MKKLLTAALFPWLAAFFGQTAIAQDTQKTVEDKKETQEIIIRKKGDKDVTLNLQINGDKVTVNGKPLVEFNDDGITINNKKIVISGDKLNFDFNGINFDDFDVDNIKGLNFDISGSQKTRPFLGVSTDKTDDGAKIISVTKESAAEAAGLKADDIITKINDTKVTGPADLFTTIGKLKPKDEIKVSYKRGSDKEKTVKATLQETTSAITGPDGDVLAYTLTGPDGAVKSFSFPRRPTPPTPPVNGWDNDRSSFRNMIVTMKKQKLGIKIQDTEEGNGVKILDVDDASPAATAGIRKDDILTEVNGKKIANTDEAREQMQANSDNINYPVKVKRNGSEITLNVKIPKKLKTTNL